MNRDQAIDLMAALVGAFPGTTIPEETVSIYSRFLVDIEPIDGVNAVADWILSEKRFPRIAELRESVEKLRGEAPPDLDLAWREVLKTVSAVGIYRTPTWTHPAIAAAVEAIGWRDLCSSTEPGITRAHFERAYKTSTKRLSDPARKILAKSLAEEVRARIAAKQPPKLPPGKK